MHRSSLDGTMAKSTLTDTGDGYAFELKCTQDVDIWQSTRFIPEDHPRIPYDSNDTHNDRDCLCVGKMPEYSRKRILIQFEDVPEEYAGWHTKRAKIYLYYWGCHYGSLQKQIVAPAIPRDLQVHQVLKSWNESDTTNKIRFGSSEWKTPFLDVDGSDAASKALDSVTMYPRPQGYVEFDVTEAVRNWCAGQPNHGVLIWATNEDVDGREIGFYSRRRDDEDEEPLLMVQCSY